MTRQPSRPDRTLRRRLAAIALVGSLVAAVWPGTAFAAPALDVQPGSGVPGATLVARGTGFPQQIGIEIRWAAIGGAIVAEGTSDGSGAFDIPFKIPAAATPGQYRVFACVVATRPCPVSAADVVTVLAPATPRPTPAPTPAPTPTPTPPPTAGPGPTGLVPPTQPVPSATPTSAPSDEVAAPTPTPGPTLPVPSFPLAGPTPTPAPLPLVAITPAPAPPNGLTASPGPFPDLDVLAIEVTQGIQDLNNNMPLVAARRTYVRVHLDVDGANDLPHTYGALEARRNGQQIGWIWPENGPITAHPNGGNRLDLDDSLYFRLPNAWLNGTVSLTAFVYSHGILVPWSAEPSWENNFETETVTFHEAQPLDIHLVTLHLNRSFHPTDVVREYEAGFGLGTLTTGAASDTARILAGLWRYHPISSLAVDVFPVPIGPLDHDDGDEWDLGDCRTTVIETPEGWSGLWLADWRPLMEDPDAELPLDSWIEPDRDTVWVLDRTYDVSHFYIREGDVAQLFGSSTGGGPAPVPGAPAFVDGCPNPDGESGQPNSTVALWRVFYDWADAREFFVGMVHPSLPTRWAGLAGSKDTAWVNMNPATWTSVPWYHVGAATMAHEVAHLAGLKHVACKDDDGDGVPDEVAGGAVDPTHPQQQRFPACSLAEVREHGYYGFDVYHASFGLSEPTVISNNPAVSAKNAAYPLMGYKGQKWADPYHYCRLLVYYDVPCDPDTIDEPWSSPAGTPDGFWFPTGHGDPPPDPGLPLVFATGVFDREATSASLEGVLSIADPSDALLRRLAAQDALPEEEIVGELLARDAGGAVLRRVPIADHSSAEERGPRFVYDLLVPLDPATVSFELVGGDGDVLATLPVSAHAPAAAWLGIEPDRTLPIEDLVRCCAVEADDADGDPLSSTLLYSPDGERWQVLGSAAGTRVELDPAVVDRLPGSEAGRLRMLVSDGIHTTIATGEPTIRLPNRAPTAWIDAPAAALSAPLGAPVTLSGSASDAEDRLVDDDGLAWSSSLDGRLGSGPEIRTRELSAGRHTLVLTATDSDGATGVATIELAVDPSTVGSGPDQELEVAVSALFERRGAGLDPVPVAALGDAGATDAGGLPVAAFVALALLGLALGAAWVLSVRARPAALPSGGTTGAGDATVDNDETITVHAQHDDP